MSFKFSVVHPTARVYPQSPLYWRHSMLAFHKACDNPQDVEYIVVVHESNLHAFELGEGFGEQRKIWGDFRVVITHGPNTGVAQGNCGGRAAQGQIIVGSMDDLFPPLHWDTLLRDALEVRRTYPERTGYSYLPTVVHVSSGSPLDDQLFIPQICTKSRFDQFSYGAHPSYESMYCDNEFTDVARRDGVVLSARHIVFEHRHPMLGKGEMDDVYRMENRAQAYSEGLRNYETRKALGFPIDPEWRMPPAPPGKVIALCLPGETFGIHWVHALVNFYGYLLTKPGVTVQIVLQHTSNVYNTRYLIAQDVIGMNPRPHYVLWIDDDNIVTPEQIQQLMDDLDHNPELAGVVGWCWCEKDGGMVNDPSQPFRMSCGLQGEDLAMLPLQIQDSISPIVPIDWSGFPCVMLRGGTLERLGPEGFVPIVRPDVNFGFMSEDASWFLRAKQAGLKFAVDLRVKVPHAKVRAIEPQWRPVPADPPKVRSDFEKEFTNVGD